jgi:hypothetical protein
MRAALPIIDAYLAELHAGGCLGWRRGHNGSNQRQSDGSGYANPSQGDATGKTLGGQYRFHKQMRAR